MLGQTSRPGIKPGIRALAGYDAIQRVASRLNTSDDVLLEFAQAGWIYVIEQRGQAYLTKHQQDRAKYVLHLKLHHGCGSLEISRVMSILVPPYRLRDVDRILVAAESGKPDDHTPGRWGVSGR